MLIDESSPDAPVFSSVFTQTGKYLIAGGATWSGTGYVYDVSMLTYFFDGILTASPTSVTFGTADPTFDRIDAIVVNQAGTVSIIAGTASADPAEPVIPDTQLAVQYVLVEAATTQPTVTVENIYLENVEWTTSNYTVSGSPVGSTNFAATNSPYAGTKCVDNLRDSRTGDLFTRSASLTLSNFAQLALRVRFTAPIAANRSLLASFQDSSGTTVGRTVNLFSNGLSRTVTTTWQLCLVPVANFGSITSVKSLKLIMGDTSIISGGRGAQVEWDLDNIILSSGTVPVTSAPGVTIEVAGTIAGTQGTVNFDTPSAASIPVSAANDIVNSRVNVTVGNNRFYFDPSGSHFFTGVTGIGGSYIDNFNDQVTIQGDSVFMQDSSANTLFQSSSSGGFQNVTVGDIINNGYFSASGNSGSATAMGAFATPAMQAFSGTGSVTIQDGKRGIYYNPGTTQATATITLPAAPVDGQETAICFGGTVTAGTVVTILTIAPNSGQTVIGTLPTTATVDTHLAYKYRSATSQWYRIV